MSLENDPQIQETVALLVEEDGRYLPDAYFFVLDTVAAAMGKASRSRQGHVGGKELCQVGTTLALERFGPFAWAILQRWGIRTTMDLGDIVFAFVGAKILGLSSSDRREDFLDVYDLEAVLRAPYRAEPPYQDMPAIHTKDLT